jgi:AraC-like DNA-binding protein
MAAQPRTNIRNIRCCARRPSATTKYRLVLSIAAFADPIPTHAAEEVGASKRTLTRRMQMVLGKSPLSCFQSLRVQRAVHLLKTSSASVDEIAERVGYTEGSILRVLLRRRLWLRNQGDQAVRVILRKVSVRKLNLRPPQRNRGRLE